MTTEDEVRAIIHRIIWERSSVYPFSDPNYQEREAVAALMRLMERERDRTRDALETARD